MGPVDRGEEAPAEAGEIYLLDTGRVAAAAEIVAVCIAVTVVVSAICAVTSFCGCTYSHVT